MYKDKVVSRNTDDRVTHCHPPIRHNDGTFIRLSVSNVTIQTKDAKQFIRAIRGKPCKFCTER